MLKSIRSQLIFVIVALMVLFLLQAFLNQKSQSRLSSALDAAGVSFSDLKQVKAIEYELLNLQRTVLLFINTGSPSAVTRFSRSMAKINNDLARFELLKQSNLTSTSTDNSLESMRLHLSDYEANFQQVVETRAQRERLLQQGTIKKIDDLKIALKTSAEGVEQKLVDELLLFLADAEVASIRYMAQPGGSYINLFNENLAHAESLSASLPDSLREASLDLIKGASSDFLALTQLIQGNLFLVNVVMAGAANEFLFLSTQLVEEVSYAVEQNRKKSQEEARKAKLQSILFSTIAILVAFGAALFSIFRIVVPIRAITEVFKKLSRNLKVESIPGLQRKDEIGALAIAAQVFSDKNNETQALLVAAQNTNARMEHLNQELSKEKLKAENATISKSMFLANMSHEIRTPMNGVIGLIELASEKTNQPEVLTYLEKASYSSEILMTVINDILDFSKIEAGKMEIEKCSFELHAFIDNLIGVVSLRTKEKNLQMKLEVDPGLPDRVIGDPLRLSQILMNLSNNAVKFTESGYISIRFSGELNDAGNELMLCIEVEDTGIGMTKEQLDKIFKPFEQADGSTDRKYGGTGLGLSIVTQLLSLMNGTISAESEQGKGSCFQVRLPLAAFKNQPDIFAELPMLPDTAYYINRKNYIADSFRIRAGLHGQCISEEKSEILLTEGKVTHLILEVENHKELRHFLDEFPELSRNGVRIGVVVPSLIADSLSASDIGFSVLVHPFSPLQFKNFIITLDNQANGLAAPSASDAGAVVKLNGHLLLVEDNDINQVVAGELLKGLGLTFDVAENGAIAVSKIENYPHYDAVLMDIQMPEMDGYTATQNIRSNGHVDIPIIGLSANAMKEDSNMGKQAGMDDYITKPIKRDVLIETLNRYL